MNEAGRQIGATIEKRNGCRISLLSEESIAMDASLRITLPEAVLLAQVSSCSNWDKGFIWDVEVVHSVAVASDLARLMSAVMDGGVVTPVRSPESVASRRIHVV